MISVAQIVQRWNVFAVAAAAICTCISGFIAAPPLYQDQTSFHFLVFLATLLIAFWSVPLYLWNKRVHLQSWMLCAFVFLTLSVVGYFYYDKLLITWTFFYPPPARAQAAKPEREIQGYTLSRDSLLDEEQLIQAGELHGPAELAWDAGGQFGEVWPNPEERNSRERKLEWFYIVLCLVFASTIVTTVQATYCLNQAAPGR